MKALCPSPGGAKYVAPVKVGGKIGGKGKGKGGPSQHFYGKDANLASVEAEQAYTAAQWEA